MAPARHFSQSGPTLQRVSATWALSFAVDRSAPIFADWQDSTDVSCALMRRLARCKPPCFFALCDKKFGCHVPY